jgi:beta-lactamase class A
MNMARRTNLLLALALTTSGVAYGLAGAADTEELRSRVETAAREFKGTVGVYAKDLSRGVEFSYHPDEVFATASIFKVPVMIELFARAERGELRLDARRKLPRAGISRHGGGVLKTFRDEPDLTLLDYCRVMIDYSDNMATDVLMQLLDARAITATMERMGWRHTRVSGNCTLMHYRMVGIESSTATDALDALILERAKARALVPGVGFADRTIGGNVTTPREMGMIFEKLERGEVVSRDASARMIEILKQNTNRTLIPKDLPADTVVAHKHGSSSVVRADAGIVYLAHGPVIVSIFTYADPEGNNGVDLISRVAAAIVRWSHSLATR